MKKLLYIFLVCLLAISCEENVIGNFETHVPDYSTEIGPSKRGVAYAYNTKSWSHKTSEQAGHWFYHWGNTPKEEIPENIEYVPMFWGRSGVTDEEIARLIQLKNDGIVKFVLGFNEPDGHEQSNMSVDEAIALWPKLEEIGVPLVSPAVVGSASANPWMIEFMEKAKAEGLRIDYLAYHTYPGHNVGHFLDNLKKAHDAFGLPIWITEFAVADWTAQRDADNKYSEAQVLEFMSQVLPALDEIEWIKRYAWFDDGDQSRPALASSRLYTEEGALTSVGAYYMQHMSNNTIGPGTDTEYTPPVDDDELMTNGHFEGGTWENVVPGWATWQAPNGWTGYNSSTVGTDTTEMSDESHYCARLLNGSSALIQVVTVESGKTYDYSVTSRWKEDIGVGQKVIFKDHTLNKKIVDVDLPSFAEWTSTNGELTIPAGVNELRIILWNGEETHFYFDNFSLKEKE